MSSEPQDDPVARAIRDLGSSDIKQLNRIAACEALLYSLLARIEPKALVGLAEEYDQALVRMAEQIPPGLQRPELWSNFAGAIADRIKSVQASDGSPTSTD